jgi:prolyl 4-hydroxylase
MQLSNPNSCAIAAEDGYLKLNDKRSVKICEKSPIYKIEHFLTDEECDMLIELGRDKVVESTFLGQKNSQHIRDSSSYYAYNAGWLSEKVYELTGKTVREQEAPQICRYRKGEQYTAHYDYFHVGTESGDGAIRNGGQRVGTVLIYLNTCEEGGHTFFPKLNLSLKPTKGTAIVFFPCKFNGEIDTETLHAALPAVDEKWVSQVWIRQFHR